MHIAHGARSARVSNGQLLDSSRGAISGDCHVSAEEQLHTLLAAYETSLNAGDAGRIEQLYTEDGVFMPAGFPTASGRSAVRGAYDAVFKNIRIAIHFTVDELTVKGDFAYARTHSAGTSTVVATGASGPEANRELFIFARTRERLEDRPLSVQQVES